MIVNEHIKESVNEYEKVKTFKYFDSLLSHNTIQEKIIYEFKAGTHYYYSVYERLSSRRLPENLNIKIYKKIILPVVSYIAVPRNLLY